MRVRTQFGIQVIGGVVNALLFVALTPILIQSLGLERYGILLLILGFTIYVGLAEFGLGAATSREMSAAEPRHRSVILGTSLSLGCIFGLAAGILFAMLSLPVVGQVLGGGQVVSQELRSAGWAFFFLGLSTVVSSGPQGALLGLSKFVQLNVINVAGTAASILGPAAYSMFLGKDMSGLVFCVALGRALTGIAALTICRRAAVGPLFTVDLAVVRRLLTYGGWSTATGILHRLTNSIDRVLVGSFLGAAAVPVLVVPQAALGRSQVFGASLMSAAFPRLARVGERDGLEQACYKAVLLLTPVYVAGISATPLLLYLWLGDSFANAAYKAAILLGVSAWLELVGYVPYVILQARALVRSEAAIGALISIPNVALLAAAIFVAGVEGVAAVAILRSFAYLVARIIATGSAAVPMLDIGINGLLVGFSAALALMLHGWVAGVAGVLALVVASVVSVACRPAFLDDAISQLWTQRIEKGRQSSVP